MSLHDRIEAAVRERMAVAQAATPGPWTTKGRSVVAEAGFRGCVIASVGYMVPGDNRTGWPEAADAAFIAANDPDRILRDCAEDLDVLGRHQPVDPYDLRCRQCYEGSPWPCAEVRSLARRYGITEEGDGDG